MKKRRLGPQGREVTECGLGCWQLGGGWGNPWDNDVAQQILDAAYASGVRFFDTADGYGGGESERSLGQIRRTHPDITIATKLGRSGGMYPDRYSRESMYAATRASLARLGVDRLDLTQLHCVPTEVLRAGKVFDWLREQRAQDLIAAFGASVETVEEGLICLEQEGLTSLQIIFNIFRQKPLEELMPRAREKGVGIITRLPLASGLLTGKFTARTTFGAGDHRNYNRDGQRFNVGETFAGLPFELGVELADALKGMLPEGMSMVEMALRWILDHDAVSVMIPGASSPAQARANARISDLPPLPEALHQELSAFYAQRVHAHIRGPY
ncbi:MAG: aldo/keto reductase [Anaerolineae bacterium]|nr:aldo/keto reductase [Anaerolineae bacterium]